MCVSVCLSVCVCVCVSVCLAGVSCRLRKAQCYRQSFSPAISCWSSNRRTNVSVCQCVLFGCVFCTCILHITFVFLAYLWQRKLVCVCVCVSGCLLTIILLMRALDPLGHEKETLAHFQTLKVRIHTTTTIKDALAAGNNQIIYIIKIRIRVLKIRNAI